MYNTAGDEVINAQGELDFDVLYHSYRHADYLRQQAIDVGQAFSGAFQESPEEFVLRVLELAKGTVHEPFGCLSGSKTPVTFTVFNVNV